MGWSRWEQSTPDIVISHAFIECQYTVLPLVVIFMAGNSVLNNSFTLSSPFIGLWTEGGGSIHTGMSHVVSTPLHQPP